MRILCYFTIDMTQRINKPVKDSWGKKHSINLHSSNDDGLRGSPIHMKYTV